MNETSFLGLEFSPLKPQDHQLLDEFLDRYPQPLTGYTLPSLAAWTPFFHYEWVFAEPETLLISYVFHPDPHRNLLQPVGLLASQTAQMILDRAGGLSYALKMAGVSARFIKRNPNFAKSFTIREDRALSNYIYKTSSLAHLRGRKYARKRNLLSQASGLYTWSCRILDARLVDSCFEVLDSIVEEENPRIEGMLARELAALEYTLRHFDELQQQGLLITIDNRPVAFSIFEAINPKTVAIHFERALRSYKGLYQVINWETAKIIASQGFEYINREEDLGDPGLRDAKLSYNPIEIAPAYELTIKSMPRTL
jgi:hypothetical protein